MDNQIVTHAELRNQRTLWGEIEHRLGWLVLGTLAGIALFFIPVIGWLFGLGLWVAMLMKLFGKRDRIWTGPCPVCGTGFYISDRQVGVDCPACSSRLVVRDGKFIHFTTTSAAGLAGMTAAQEERES